MNKYICIFLIVLLFISFAVRLINVGTGDLNNDEAKTALGVALPQSFVLPDLSVVSQQIFGINEFGARLPFVIFGTLGIMLYYFLGKEIGGDKTGLFFAAAGALLPGNILLSRTSLLDVPLVTSWIFLLIFWIRYERQNSRYNKFFLFIALLIPMWLKIQAVYLLFSLGIYLIWFNRGKFWQDKRFWLMSAALVPFFSYYITQFQQLWDLKHYVTLEFGRSAGDLGQFLIFYFQSHTIWLVMAFVGIVFFLKNLRARKSENNLSYLLAIFFGVILLALILIPKRFYYTVMLDIPIVYFAWYLAGAAQKNKFNFAYFSAGFVFCVLSLIFLGNFNDYYCQKNILNCRWQQNAAIINKDIDRVVGPKYVFLDPLIGYEGKWYLNFEAYKYDYLANFIRDFGSKNTAVIVTYKNRSDNLLDFGEWAKLNDYGTLESYIRTPK